MSLYRNLDDLYEIAKGYADEGEYQQAVDKIEEVLTYNSEYPSARELYQTWQRYAQMPDIPKGKNLYEEGKDEELLEYYRRSPKQLALDYISDPNSLTKDELERLIYEIDKKDEKILENSLPVDEPVLNKILERDSLELSNGFKIYL